MKAAWPHRSPGRNTCSRMPSPRSPRPALPQVRIGASGVAHANDYLMVDKESVYVGMAKLLAMAAIDMLSEEAAIARRIVDEQRPKLSKQDYLAFNRKMMALDRFEPEPLVGGIAEMGASDSATAAKLSAE